HTFIIVVYNKNDIKLQIDTADLYHSGSGFKEFSSWQPDMDIISFGWEVEILGAQAKDSEDETEDADVLTEGPLLERSEQNLMFLGLHGIYDMYAIFKYHKLLAQNEGKMKGKGLKMKRK
ncbi:hypothetical protein ACJX0J_015911, partial [Zea mays]